jgi:ATP/maltotriose-dependent transcriptional regulator MalT
VPGSAFEARARAGIVLSEVALAEGRADDAVRFAREAEAVVCSGDWLLLRAEVALVLAHAMAAAGQAEAAAGKAQEAERLFAGKGYAGGCADARRLLESLGARRT